MNFYSDNAKDFGQASDDLIFHFPCQSNSSTKIRETASQWLEEIFTNGFLLDDKVLFMQHMQELNQRVLAPELTQSRPFPSNGTSSPHLDQHNPPPPARSSSCRPFEPLQPLPQPTLAVADGSSSILEQFRGLRSQRETELSRFQTHTLPVPPTESAHPNEVHETTRNMPASSMPLPKRSFEPALGQYNSCPAQDPLLRESLSNMRETLAKVQNRTGGPEPEENPGQSQQLELRESLDSLNELRQRFEKNMNLVLDQIPEEEPLLHTTSKDSKYEKQGNTRYVTERLNRKKPGISPNDRYRLRPSEQVSPEGSFGGSYNETGRVSDEDSFDHSEVSSTPGHDRSRHSQRLLPRQSQDSLKSSSSSKRYSHAPESEEGQSPPSYAEDPDSPILKPKASRPINHGKRGGAPSATASLRESLHVEDSAIARAELKFSTKTLEILRRCFGSAVLKTRNPTGAVPPSMLSEQVEASAELLDHFGQAKISQLSHRLDSLKRYADVLTWTDFLEEISQMESYKSPNKQALQYPNYRQDDIVENAERSLVADTPKSAFDCDGQDDTQSEHVGNKTRQKQQTIQESIDLSNLNTMKLDLLLEHSDDED